MRFERTIIRQIEAEDQNRRGGKSMRDRQAKRKAAGGVAALWAAVVVLLLGTAPAVLAVHQTAPRYAFVPNAAEGTVSAIDLAGNETAWTVAVSQPAGESKAEAAHGIAVSPDGATVYAGDATSQQIVVLDTESRRIIARIPIEHGVHGIDISPDGRTVWVGGSLADYPWLSAVSVVDTATRRVETIVSPGVGDASHLAVSPDGREVWIASVTSNLLWIVDAERRTLTDVVPLGPGTALSPGSPEGEKGLIGFNEVALSPDGRLAYAVGPESSVVYSIDAATRRPLHSVRAGERAHGIAVSPDGREVWVANRSGSLTILNAATLAELSTLPMGEYSNHVAFTPDGRFAYVSRQTDIAVVDPRSRQIVKLLPVGKEPHEISLED
jgi:YVTN family beta-propeller protein